MSRRDSSRERVPDVVAPPGHHPRFPLSVGLRGVPAIAIIVGHAWFFTGGFGGYTEGIANRAMVRMDGMVALFFLLSAFLLYRPMIAHRTGGPDSPRVGDYAKRRFLRLYPAYWVALTVLTIVFGLHGAFSENWWAFYSLTDFLDIQNLHQVCEGEEIHCGLSQSWTLGVDMTFYAILPLYAALTALLARGREVRSWVRWELILLAVLGMLSLILGSEPFSLRDEPWYRFSFLGHFFWFALGLAIAVVSVSYAFRPSEMPRPLAWFAVRPEACWACAIAIYLVTVFVFFPAPFIFAPFLTGQEYNSLNVLQGAAAVLLFIPAVFANPNRGVPARILGHPVLMWLGLISYGLLLWNVTISINLGLGGADAGFMTVLILGGLLTLPLAAASYYLVERPLMRFKYRPVREAYREWRAR